MEEPSVLDYVKSLFRLHGGPPLEIPWEQAEQQPVAEAGSLGATVEPAQERPAQAQALAPTAEPVAEPVVAPAPVRAPAAEPVVAPEPLQTAAPQLQAEPQEQATALPLAIPWRSLLALLAALAGQHSLQPALERAWLPGTILLLVSVALLAWACLRDEWQAAPIPLQSEHIDPPKINFASLLIGLFLGLVSFLSFGALEFTYSNLALALLALGFVAASFWIRPRLQGTHLSALLSRRQWSVNLSGSRLLALAGIGLVLFFRFYRLGQVPPEMNSDHAEKILDVLRVLNGQALIFFPTNGGREALQFYLAAALHRFLGMQIDFMLLKSVTALVGFVSLLFIYLLGLEVANRRVAALAFLFAGVAYWPNVVSRVGLRLPFYVLFTAATLYFLLRGIRASRQNDFIFAGVSLGLGFYGYSADRILPLLVVVAVGLYLVHVQSTYRRQHTWVSTLALALVSFILFLPLLRYLLAEPDSFLFRTLSRMGSLERPIEDPVWLIFLNNMGRALAMFSWDAGEVWPISIPHYPALDVVAGALFYMGAGLLLIRYLRRRHWLDLFLLVSIPVLLLPSVLALAFPAENPNLYRTGGAMVPVFLMVAIALDGLVTALSSRIGSPGGALLAWVVALLLFGCSAGQSYSLVFDRYYSQYRLSAWNSSEMGQVARDFIDTVGSPENVWVMGYPHWVDTRLVAINSGYPGRDYQLFLDQLDSTTQIQGAKLFIMNLEDEQAIQALSLLYPQGWFQLYTSKVETKDFLMFFVLPTEDAQP
ncbi:MAG: glycosyltransferase family 39 protein [Anaerolineales bacterium]|nr:glycosyltransferase family 39 protein [Anaerolineales bacterium]